MLVRDLEDAVKNNYMQYNSRCHIACFAQPTVQKVKGYLISNDVKQKCFLLTNLSSTTLIWSNPSCIKVTPEQSCGVLTRCSIQETDRVAELTGQKCFHDSLFWAGNGQGSLRYFSGPDDIISTGSQWCGESSQWSRANGPDVGATWPAPGLRMLPSTEPVTPSRGSVVCRSPFLI